MKDNSKNYLHFSKVERNGLLFLLLLFVGLLSYPWLAESDLPTNKTDFMAYKTVVAKFEESIVTEEQGAGNQVNIANRWPKGKKSAESKKKEKPEIVTSLFKFDPNTISKEDLLRLGVERKVAQRWVNYRLTGATFKNKEDVAKIYGLDETLFNRTVPFMVFDTKSTTFKPTPKVENRVKGYENVTPVLVRKKPEPIAVNSASEEEWKTLHGIGPVLSERIVKFRDKLGGFVSLAQVQEVYGLADSTFLGIKPLLILDESKLSKLNINAIKKEELSKHPYLKWKQANIIVNYREQHGPFGSKEDLYKLRGIPKELIDKIIPYLNFSYD